jgi:sulfate adenylyltransferase
MTATTAFTTPVHGGLSQPVNRITTADPSAWKNLPKVEVDETDQTTLYRIADGTLSPLVGPMGERDYKTVLDSLYIEREGKQWAWSIPIILPVTDAEAAEAKSGAKLGLYRAGQLFGVLTVTSVYPWDKERFIQEVYGTERTDHPGANLWLSDTRTKLVGGEIELLPFQDKRSFAGRIMNPTQTRSLVERRGYEQTIAFQTRNPLHRAHEYALVYGAEVILRETGKKTGVVLNPLVGQLKGDDVPASTRMKTYEVLIEGRHLGQGDMDEELWKSKGQNLNENLHLVGLDMRMYYGGPREAVMHAIYRQNLGFTHFIIGRKHADAPFADGSPIWGDFDAQTIFGKLDGDLQIKTVNVGFAAFFEEIGRVGLMEANKGNTVVNISGTKVREVLTSGELPDARIMRPSTAQVLVEYYKTKQD